jgi:hypothetical protein
MLQVGFEPIISVFEQAKTLHALNSATNVIGSPYLVTVCVTRHETELLCDHLFSQLDDHAPTLPKHIQTNTHYIASLYIKFEN